MRRGNDNWERQPRWPRGTPTGPKGPGGGRFRDTGPGVPSVGGDWAEGIARRVAGGGHRLPDDLTPEARDFAETTIGHAARAAEQYPGLEVAPTQHDGVVSARALRSQHDVSFTVSSGGQRVGRIMAARTLSNGQTHYSTQPEFGLDGGGRMFDSIEESLDYLSSLVISDASKTDLDRYHDDLLWRAGATGDEMWDHGRGVDNRRLAGLIEAMTHAREMGEGVEPAAAALRRYLIQLGAEVPTEPGGERRRRPRPRR